MKKISFEDYDKYFKDLMSSPDINNIYFYKQTQDKITITLSWDLFIIVTEITISQILQKYQDSNLDAIDVVTSDEDIHPAIKKFKSEYLERAIPEL